MCPALLLIKEVVIERIFLTKWQHLYVVVKYAGGTLSLARWG
jgi:hypothetical protein